MQTPRIALWLFALYLVIYVGFMGVSAFAPGLMAATPLAGLPVSLLYGLLLIGLAFVLAALYVRVAR